MPLADIEKIIFIMYRNQLMQMQEYNDNVNL